MGRMRIGSVIGGEVRCWGWCHPSVRYTNYVLGEVARTRGHWQTAEKPSSPSLSCAAVRASDVRRYSLASTVRCTAIAVRRNNCGNTTRLHGDDVD